MELKFCALLCTNHLGKTRRKKRAFLATPPLLIQAPITILHTMFDKRLFVFYMGSIAFYFCPYGIRAYFP